MSSSLKKTSFTSLRIDAKVEFSIHFSFAIQGAYLVSFPPAVFIEFERARDITFFDRGAEYHVFTLQKKTSHGPSLPGLVGISG
jgi:hypothetical protein